MHRLIEHLRYRSSRWYWKTKNPSSLRAPLRTDLSVNFFRSPTRPSQSKSGGIVPFNNSYYHTYNNNRCFRERENVGTGAPRIRAVIRRRDQRRRQNHNGYVMEQLLTCRWIRYISSQHTRHREIQ